MKYGGYKDYKFTNLVHTVFLLFSMAGLLAMIGWLIAGITGIKFALFIGIVSFVFRPRFDSGFIMNAHRTRQLYPGQIPELHRITKILSQRAGLAKAPNLYYQPSRTPNAFAAGSREDSAICITKGLLNTLSVNEMAGIIGHEITHIKNNDMQVMGLAALFYRVTGYVSFIGQVLFIFSLPAIFMSNIDVPFFPFLMLITAPSLSLLLNFALSRTREFEADLGSASLMEDPVPLTSALKKLSIYRHNLWRHFFVPGFSRKNNSWLQTHPPTEERIKRLMSMSANYQMDTAIRPHNQIPSKLARPVIKPRKRLGPIVFYLK